MKKTQMKKTIAIATGLLLATGLFANKAQAQTANVDFSGTAGLENTCTLTATEVGTLALYVSDNKRLGSDPSQTANSGVFGEVTLNCTLGSATMSIDNPVVKTTGVPNSTPDAYLLKSDLTNLATSSNTPLGVGTGIQVSNGSPVTLFVTMNAITTDSFVPLGTYDYTVTVTATAN